MVDNKMPVSYKQQKAKGSALRMRQSLQQASMQQDSIQQPTHPSVECAFEGSPGLLESYPQSSSEERLFRFSNNHENLQ